MIARLLPSLALTLAAVFFGIAVYINLAEQPARLVLEDMPLLAQWKVSFGVGFALQGSLTIAAGLAGIGAWWLHKDWRWGAVGLLMLGNWPWTLVMIAPINAALLAMAPEAADAASRALIEEWGLVHAGRTGLSFLAVGLSLWAMVQPKANRGV